MNRNTFQQVEALFHEAVAYDPALRRDFLDRIARERTPEISAMVERLLSQDLSDTRWTLGLTPDSIHEPPPLEPPGTMIGAFRLDRRLGFGGHGEVYLAEQLEPVRRQVALKMVRTTATGEAAVARFRAEQQALAVMNHPNIAAVYEAGLTDRARMYFAMAYVEGEPIDAFCDQRRLSIRARLALLLKVCRAVQHAHQKGLIHRDLKPSNILVTERDGVAEPVLIDFGIAMATATSSDADDGHAPLALGTPAYMSPEQAGAAPHDLDTRSDVYALGILLFELLTGRTPLDVLAPPGASITRIRQCIADESAPAASTVIADDDPDTITAASERGCTVARLRRQVRGDLDAIVGKAVARDRAARYQSAEALAADIENVLAHRPVSAGSRGRFRRAAQFTRRHRGPVAVAAAVFGALIIAVTGTTVGMVRADHAARESDAVNSFLQDLLTSSRALEKGATVRFVDVLADGSRMADERFADFPRLAGEVHFVLGRTYMDLGLYPDALSELERATGALHASAGLDDPLTLRASSALASLLVALLRLDEAEELARTVIEHSAPGEGAMRHPHLIGQRVLCDVMIRRGECVDAERTLRALSPQIDEHLGATSSEAYNVRMSRSTALNRMALTAPPGPEREAIWIDRLAVLDETAHLQGTRYGNEDAMPVLGAQIALARTNLEMKRYDAAAAHLQTLLPRIIDRFGTVHGHFAEASAVAAGIAYARGDYADAADHQLAALDASRGLHARGHPNVVGELRDTLPFLDAADDVDAGLASARELHELLIGYFGPDHGITLDARVWLARFCDRAGLDGEAETHFRAVNQAAPSDDRTANLITLFHAGHLARQERFDDAEQSLLELVDRLGGATVGVQSEVHPDDVVRMLIEVYAAWGRDDRAIHYEDLLASMHH